MTEKSTSMESLAIGFLVIGVLLSAFGLNLLSDFLGQVAFAILILISAVNISKKLRRFYSQRKNRNG